MSERIQLAVVFHLGEERAGDLLVFFPLLELLFKARKVQHKVYIFMYMRVYIHMYIYTHYLYFLKVFFSLIVA